MKNIKISLCNKCKQNFEYKASEIKYENQPNGCKDVTGSNMTDTIKVVDCSKCGKKKAVYDKLDVTGNFMD